MAKPKPALADLPEELISNIACRLWSDDIQSLRLTCKALEQKTLHEFATEYFGSKAILITTDALKVLGNIARSRKLSKYLTSLYVLTSYFSESALTCPRGNTCVWKPTVRHREAWKYYCDDQKDLASSGRDLNMLSEALRDLPALKLIIVVDTTNAVLESDVRPWLKTFRLTGRNPMIPSERKNAEYLKKLSHVWNIVTSAIADSGIRTLKHFGTSLGRGENALSVPSDIRFSDAKLGGLRKAFKSLVSLHVQLTSKISGKSASKDASLALAKSVKVQRRFAAIFPPLEDLDLCFDSREKGEIANNTTIMPFLANLNLMKMKTLSLDAARADRPTLISVLENLHSIQDLRLTHIDLSKGSWVPILRQLQSMTPHLTHLHLMFLLESGKKVYFLKQPEEEDLGADPDDFYDDFDDEEDDDDDDEEEDDLPPLETMEGDIISTATAVDGHPGADQTPNSMDTMPHSLPPPPTASQATGTSATKGPTLPSKSTHGNMEHKSPCQEDLPERGYYVCLQDEQIREQLPTFIAEYNTGEHINEVMQGFGGAIPIPLGAGNPNDLMNGLAASLGLPPGYMGMPMGGGGAGGAQGGAGATQGGLGAANTGPGAGGGGAVAGGKSGRFRQIDGLLSGL